ncbi:hypothetical protein EJ02DRAFT_154913 [Clathrospora elynae]|uniref:WD40 repeat-like protein n=1 Tax=Clathrospora elynae TaxID=706981 RepID=A0A6A5STJ3_9PLEO|nr:hypothetical protein EJ02DRAFT_154913 [Clathrospora elynae]
MDSVDVSSKFKSTSLSVPSPTATHVACLNGARLQIRCLSTFGLVRSIAVPSSHHMRSVRIAWSPPASAELLSATSGPSSTSTAATTTTTLRPRLLTPPRHSATRSARKPLPPSNRLLISDDGTTRVYDLRDEKWSAVVSNGSGGLGKNVHVEFGANEDEVLVWSDFGACVKVWCLKTGRAVEIRDPKFSGKEGRGWGYRPCDGSRAGLLPGVRGGGGVLALLCRSSGTDVLLLLAPRTYSVLSKIELPTTDAAGLKWSRDGRWLAIWDAASAGYKLCIYTADGHLYRTISREEASEQAGSEWHVHGLGIKTVEWLPGNERLAVGGWDNRVRILSTRTFAPVVFLDHTPVIHVPSTPVYTEHVDRQGNRSFELTHQPVTPPKPLLEKNETGLMKQGIGLLSFNTDGTLCASRDDSTPCTVWLWDLVGMKPSCILVQYAPIKGLTWHPSDPARLLIQTKHEVPVVYLYTASALASASASQQHAPAILDLSPHINKPAGAALAHWTASWLCTPVDRKRAFLFAHQQAHVLVWPDGKDQILRFEREGEEEESDDSLYDILTGRTPVPRLSGSGSEGSGGMDEEEGNTRMGVGEEEEEGYCDSVDTVGGGLEDTFREMRGRGIVHGATTATATATTTTTTTTTTAFGENGLLGESGMDEMF